MIKILLIGPLHVPLWIAGLLGLLRRADLRPFRAFAVAYLVLLVLFLLTGGKPYYVAGWLPLLFAAGAQPLIDAVRPRWIAAVLALSTPVFIFSLPVLPVAQAGIAVAVNPDAGETIGWPEFTGQAVEALQELPPGTPVVTQNYGEAGALARFGPAQLRVYSGHNAYATWGQPPGRAPVLLVGFDDPLVREVCGTTSAELGVISSPYDIDNEENGTLLRQCTPTREWAQLWPLLRR